MVRLTAFLQINSRRFVFQDSVDYRRSYSPLVTGDILEGYKMLHIDVFDVKFPGKGIRKQYDSISVGYVVNDFRTLRKRERHF